MVRYVGQKCVVERKYCICGFVERGNVYCKLFPLLKKYKKGHKSTKRE